uniref:Uncharacterized protein n=1 Tax=Anguilla anguilla TaxID=7936 RepID=A0A0E9RSV8_ANGAN
MVVVLFCGSSVITSFNVDSYFIQVSIY